MARGHTEVLEYPCSLFLEMLEATFQEEQEEMRRLAVAIRVGVWAEKKDFERFLKRTQTPAERGGGP